MSRKFLKRFDQSVTNRKGWLWSKQQSNTDLSLPVIHGQHAVVQATNNKLFVKTVCGAVIECYSWEKNKVDIKAFGKEKKEEKLDGTLDNKSCDQLTEVKSKDWY